MTMYSYVEFCSTTLASATGVPSLLMTRPFISWPCMAVVTEMIIENRNSNLFMIVCLFVFANVAKRLPAECFYTLFYTFLYIGRIGAEFAT